MNRIHPIRWSGGVLAAAAAILFVLSLAGCGKKNAPVPPPGAKITYPRAYPSE